MASISNDASGGRRLQFVGVDGRRKTIRLGGISQKAAEAIARHVEQLLAAKISGQPLDRQTAAWLGDLGEPLRAKLVKAGLIEAAAAPAVPTLGDFLSQYLEKKTDIKPQSLFWMQQVVRNLLEFFGPERRLDSINAGDAGDFQTWLKTAGRHGRAEQKGLSSATVAKRLQQCQAFFLDAVKRKYITESPFADLRRPNSKNPSRQQYIPVEVIEQLIEQEPSSEWKLLLAMSRHLGVRVPSEPFSMTWDCVNWDSSTLRIPSPKTEKHGKGYRLVPLLEPVRVHLERVFEEAAEGSRYIFEGLRQRNSVRAGGGWGSINLRQQLLRMLARAGVRPWPRLWHNLRSSAQTDLAGRFPLHVVCEWLGNTQAIAAGHYLQVTPDHIRQAVEASRAAQNPAQQGAESTGKERKGENEGSTESVILPVVASSCDLVHKCSTGEHGFEP